MKTKMKIGFELVKAIVIALLFTVFVRAFCAQIYVVDGHSMDQTLAPSERVLINKIPYHVHAADRGDIIVFHENSKEDWIKRVIGVPGDEIAIVNGVLYVNGEKVDEPYINGAMPHDLNFPKAVGTTYQVGEGKVFVMGDNRDVSVDSRVIGAIDISKIVGRADLVVYPFDHMFVIHNPGNFDHPGKIGDQ